MEYKLYILEEIRNILTEKQNREELNKIMGAISDKHDVLSDDKEEIDNVQLEEKIYSK